MCLFYAKIIRKRVAIPLGPEPEDDKKPPEEFVKLFFALLLFANLEWTWLASPFSVLNTLNQFSAGMERQREETIPLRPAKLDMEHLRA